MWEHERSVKEADLLSFREILDFRDALSFARKLVHLKVARREQPETSDELL